MNVFILTYSKHDILLSMQIKPGEIRIIGGQWRGRKLKVPTVLGLRPTPDRVRETLFNWLSPLLQGAYCLDAFAGSGALGFEALSRGAAHVVMIDQSPLVVSSLKEQLAVFHSHHADIYQAKVPPLKKTLKPFDIVFLDPPFKENILLSMCFYLEKEGLLASQSYIYLESPHALASKDLPANWRLLKSKKAGQVAFHLAERLSLL